MADLNMSKRNLRRKVKELQASLDEKMSASESSEKQDMSSKSQETISESDQGPAQGPTSRPDQKGGDSVKDNNDKNDDAANVSTSGGEKGLSAEELQENWLDFAGDNKYPSGIEKPGQKLRLVIDEIREVLAVTNRFKYHITKIYKHFKQGQPLTATMKANVKSLPGNIGSQKKEFCQMMLSNVRAFAKPDAAAWYQMALSEISGDLHNLFEIAVDVRERIFGERYKTSIAAQSIMSSERRFLVERHLTDQAKHQTTDDQHDEDQAEQSDATTDEEVQLPEGAGTKDSNKTFPKADQVQDYEGTKGKEQGHVDTEQIGIQQALLHDALAQCQMVTGMKLKNRACTPEDIQELNDLVDNITVRRQELQRSMGAVPKQRYQTRSQLPPPQAPKPQVNKPPVDASQATYFEKQRRIADAHRVSLEKKKHKEELEKQMHAKKVEHQKEMSVLAQKQEEVAQLRAKYDQRKLQGQKIKHQNIKDKVLQVEDESDSSSDDFEDEEEVSDDNQQTYLVSSTPIDARKMAGGKSKINKTKQVTFDFLSESEIPKPSSFYKKPAKKIFDNSTPRSRIHTTSRGSSWDHSRAVEEEEPNEQDLDEWPPNAWYLTLPVPWNTVPRKKNDKASDKNLDKLKVKHKFNGKVEKYIAWRCMILTNVHQAYGGISSKIMAIQDALDEDEPSVCDIIPARYWNARTYWRIVELLEGRYGGVQNLLTHHLTEVRLLPKISLRNTMALDKVVMTIQVYIDVLTELGRIHMAQTPEFYNMIHAKLPLLYQEEFQEWHDRKYEDEECLQDAMSFMLWARRKLRKLRTADRQHRYENASNDIITAAKDVRRVQSYVVETSDKSMDMSSKRVGSMGEESEGCDEDLEDPAVVAYGKLNSFSKSQRTEDSAKPNRFCHQCPDEHRLGDCPKFVSLTLEKRRTFCMDNDRCFRCLCKGHQMKDCRQTQLKCGKCPRKHSTLLHGSMPYHGRQTVGDDSGETSAMVVLETTAHVSDAEEEEVVAMPAQVDEFSSRISLRIVPIRLGQKEDDRVYNALLDEGSQQTFASDRARQELGLVGKTIIKSITGIGNRKQQLRTIAAWVTIKDLDRKFEKSVLVNCIPDPVGTLKPINWAIQKKYWPHLKNVDFPQCDGQSVDILIGGDCPELFASLEEIAGPPGAPNARKSVLGWTALGPVSPGAQYKDHPFGPEGSTCLLTHVRNTVRQRELEVGAFLQKDDNYAVKTYGFKQQKDCVDRELNELLHKQIRIEESILDNKKALSIEEERAMERLRNTRVMVLQPDGTVRIQLGCLWRSGSPRLENNYGYARSRWISLERGKLKDPRVMMEYVKIMVKLLESGYILEVCEADEKLDLAYYLAHFPVINEERVSTKIRMVLDGAARSGNPPKCLNDEIHPGPKMINSLVTVLHRFRYRKIAFMCDIEQMFLRVLLAPEDRKFHRILFRYPGEEKIREFEWQVHCFGNAGSPCVAIHAIKSYAAECKDRFPRACETVELSSLVDDHLDSVDTPEEGIAVLRDLSLLYKEIGFRLCKFACTDKKVMESVAEKDRAPGFDLIGDQSLPLTKALGVFWEAEPDMFTFKDFLEEEKVWTKRKVLKTYSRIFDILGLISPFIIMARLIFQELWRNKSDWDESIPESNIAPWLQWMSVSKLLTSVRVDRCLCPMGGETKSVQLHVFSDASAEAYGAVAYIRSEDSLGKVIVGFDMSSARIAPMKGQTIPRMELLGAVIAVRLANEIAADLGLSEDQVIIWTDSQNVLCWIRNTDLELQTFVSNRVKTIHEESNTKSWRWVNTENNPADHLSRGMSLDKLLQLKQWWEGPEFLQFPEEHWPQDSRDHQLTVDAEGELKRNEVVVFVSSVDYEELKDRYKNHGEWKRYIRGMAFARRFPLLKFPQLQGLRAATNLSDQGPERDPSSWPDLGGILPVKRGASEPVENVTVLANTKQLKKLALKKRLPAIMKKQDIVAIRKAMAELEQNRRKLVVEPLSAKEIRLAENHIIKVAQDESYAQTINDLKRCGKVRQTDPLLLVRPRLDESGVLRVTSRLRNVKHLKRDQKCPIIMHHKHPVSKLIIRFYHEKVLFHAGGASYTLSKLQNRFWIPKSRKMIRRLINDCVTCKKSRCRPIQQEEAVLPDFRTGSVQRVVAFSHTAIDAAGPYVVRRGKAIKKKWLLVFVCLTFKCVHLEVVSSMDTPNFLLAFFRFTARKGRPTYILTDNGGNFRRGSEEVARVWKLLSQEIGEEFQNRYPEIQWSFSPPLAPHNNGVCERMVGSAKRTISALVTEGILDEDQFDTFVIMAEGILNSRPLGYVSSDAADPEVLTPSHFMVGTVARDMSPYADVDWSLSERLAFVDRLLDQFWKRFLQELIPQLHQMNKWTKGSENLAVGDVVATLDSKERGRWPLATVMQVFPNPTDGLVRQVMIRRGNSEMRRHVCQLMLITKV